MRVLLVWPNKEQPGSKPNSLSLLAALLRRAGHQVQLLDTTFVDLGFEDATRVGTRARIFKPVDFSGLAMEKQRIDLDALVDDVLRELRPDLVAVSALSDEVPVGLRIARRVKARQPDLPVVWGNKAATLAPGPLLASGVVDWACVGEGIAFLPELLRRLEHGRPVDDLPNLAWRDAAGGLHVNPLLPYHADLDALPVFDYSIYDPRQLLKPFDGRAYRGGDHMIGWGCPNRCTYCINDSLRALYGPKAGPLRRYSVPRIVAELRELAERWGLELYKFHDEDFCQKPVSYLRELAREYRRQVRLPFTAMANARTVTPEKAELLASMGCASVSLGFESGNLWLRREVLHRAETPEQIIAATRLLTGCGIRTSSFNMLGLPFETRATIMETVELNRAAEVTSPNANFFFPYAGSELHRISVEHGFFTPDETAVYRSDRPTLTLPGISAGELIALRERFALYVKLPRALWPYLRRSERADEVGAALTAELYRLYDEVVLSGDGSWPEQVDLAQVTRRLELARARAGSRPPLSFDLPPVSA